MRKQKSEPRIFKQNHEQIYRDKRDLSSPTPCALCCCRSCTGFGCPWVKGDKKFLPPYYRLGMEVVRRCALCHRDYGFKRIYDCDYYTYYKRRRYFVKRKVCRRKKKIDLIGEKLDKVLKKLDSMGK